VGSSSSAADLFLICFAFWFNSCFAYRRETRERASSRIAGHVFLDAYAHEMLRLASVCVLCCRTCDMNVSRAILQAIIGILKFYQTCLLMD
jgi:hypothetical protein